MAVRRFTLDSDGLLRDRNGAVLGRVTALSIDLDSEFSVGAYGGRDVFLTATTTGTDQQQTLEGGAGETAKPTVSDQVARVWAHYERTVPKYGSYVLDAATVTVIRNALKVRTVDQCCRAIDGLARSKFHNGDNDRRKRYLAIRYALKGNSANGEGNAEKIDKMIEVADQSPATTVVSTLPSAGREMVAQRERHIKQSFANPGDESLLERAEAAKVWFRDSLGLVLDEGPDFDPGKLAASATPLPWRET